MPSNEQYVEETLQKLKLDAPRLSPEDIDNVIASAEYHIFQGTLTVCCITLVNGAGVIGYSNCISPENFNADIGKQLSYSNARAQIWELEGYRLRQSIHDNSHTSPTA